MPAELPIACALSATDLPERLAEMADLGHAALVGTRHDGAHAELRFAAAAGVHERVAAIVAAESHCCAFLEMRVTDEPDTVVLTIDAPEGAELVLQELLDAFRGQAQAA
jgi:MerR family copper efflux transcriptional regulator